MTFSGSIAWSQRLGVCMLLSACASERSDDGWQARQAIAFGSEDAPAAVAAVERENGLAWDLCSGALVAPDIVLTAAHCASAQSGDLDCDAAVLQEPVAVTTLRVSFVPDLSGAPDPSWEFFEVADIELLAPVGASLCDRDLALLYLARPVPAELATPLSVSSEVMASGNLVQVAGYGAGHPSGAGQRVRRLSESLEVICQGAACNGTSLEGWGGAPISAPFAGPHEFITESSGCPGDSGGPALRGDELVGILSRGFADCTAPVFGLRFEGIARAVREHAAAAGSDVPEWAELPPAGVGGTAGTANGESDGGGTPEGGMGGMPSPPATPEPKGGCQVAAGGGSSAGGWTSLLLLAFVALARRRSGPALLQRARQGGSTRVTFAVGLGVLLLGCTQSVKDTEGRTFELECKGDACRLEPAAPAAGGLWEPVHTGRLLLACPEGNPQGQRGDGRECRVLTCDGDSPCERLGGERMTCQGGVCQDPNQPLTHEDRWALCLAGTGAWTDSPEQRSRTALALSCRPPCDVPAVCKQLE